jgi:small-conductance mechanosensitive channel
MTGLSDVLSYQWLNNSIQDYLLALAVFVAGIVLLYLVQKVIIVRAKQISERTETSVDNALVSMVAAARPPFYWFISFYIALQWLDIQGLFSRIIDVILIIWLVYQVVGALQIFLERFITAKFIQEDDRASEVVVSIVKAIARVVLWAVAILFVLSNLGLNITSLIAGLGIGGLAVALAAQKILEDLFSSLAIYFDRPFAPGDFIEVGKHRGTVKKVGIKTTRITALSGEEIIISNKEITASRVRNFKRMEERRVSFTIGAIYETPTAKLREIPRIIQSIIEPIDQTRFGRAHFLEFARSSLNFEVVYYIKTREYEVYADIHQQILLAIKEALAQENIKMAYPTQTIRLVGHEAR